MINQDSLEKGINHLLEKTKLSLNDKRIKFARIEKYQSSSKCQWLLSIILNKYYNNDEINEIVIELNLKLKDEIINVYIDLSFGNGVIIKEKEFINYYNDDLLINEMNENFFKTAYFDIINAINDLSRSAESPDIRAK